jgi:NAD(P)H dehydrogenase (quinone)
MPDVNVLVTFWSRTGSTERLALAAALGAVQAKANIRLRWLRETAEDLNLASIPQWRESRERMSKEYIAPREADLLWADAIVIGTPASLNLAATELKTCLDMLGAAHREGKLRCRSGLVIASGAAEGNATTQALCAALARFNVTVVPPEQNTGADPLESARLQGRQLVEMARDKNGHHLE